MNRTPTMTDMYVFADPTWASVDLSGFHVEALDGELPRVGAFGCDRYGLSSTLRTANVAGSRAVASDRAVGS